MSTKTFYAKSRKEWREWLRKNHKKEKKVFLLKYKKHTKKPSLSHKESMEEAICYGWIDTTIKRLDDQRYIRCFARRNKNSRWSNATLGYARNLIKKRKMSKFGLEMYKQGLLKPVIDHNLPKNPEIPQDLLKELNKNKLTDYFKNLAPSRKRLFIWHILQAKKLETRNKRIKETIKNLTSQK